MVIQRLYGIKALLEQDPPNIALARIELLVAISELRLEYRTQEHTLNVLKEIPMRDHDALLKEFGW